MNNPKLKPALVGGLVFGIASAVPYIQMVNAACCALIIGAGVLASYLYFQERPPVAKTPYGDGALLGLLAGVVGAVAQTIVGAIVSALGYGAEEAAQSLAMLQQAGIELPQFLMEAIGARGLTPTALVLGLVFNLVLYAIFATIGGLVGAAIFHKKEIGA